MVYFVATKADGQGFCPRAQPEKTYPWSGPARKRTREGSWGGFNTRVIARTQESGEIQSNRTRKVHIYMETLL